jgi:hypothetical protein
MARTMYRKLVRLLSYVDPEFADKVDRYCDAKGLSESKLIRASVAKYIDGTSDWPCGAGLWASGRACVRSLLRQISVTPPAKQERRARAATHWPFETSIGSRLAGHVQAGRPVEDPLPPSRADDDEGLQATTATDRNVARTNRIAQQHGRNRGAGQFGRTCAPMKSELCAALGQPWHGGPQARRVGGCGG